jgi:serpin B
MDAVDTINHWVETLTNGMIREARGKPFSDTTMAVLINVTYFKAGWQQQFDSTATRPQPFHLAGGRTRVHPLMRGPCDCPYLENEAFQLVRVPYRGNDFAMYVLLPRPGLSLGAVEAALAADSLTAWRLRLERTWLALSLPRFRAESSTELRPPLMAVGLLLPFDRHRSDLGGMVEGKPRDTLYVGAAVQTALVEVTEEGTEAAAVTTVPIDVVTSARRTVTMVVDRPFYFIIYHEPTDTPLFIGRIVDPQ